MARVCQVTGKKPQVGHHSPRQTTRPYAGSSELQYRRFWVESEKSWSGCAFPTPACALSTRRASTWCSKSCASAARSSLRGRHMREKIKSNPRPAPAIFYTTTRQSALRPTRWRSRSRPQGEASTLSTRKPDQIKSGRLRAARFISARWNGRKAPFNARQKKAAESGLFSFRPAYDLGDSATTRL